jgi:ParB/RepB/Spo0J family partition protein
MNAPQRTPLAEPNVELVPVNVICPSSTQVQNLRRKRFNPDRITEIAASLLAVGQLQPVVVRIRPPEEIEGRKFELVLGERRWLAAQQAGLAHIEAKVCVMDDAQVLEAQLIENLQREDLHPLEEAEGYRELMAAGDIRKEDLGERIGKSRSWVYSRLNLLRLEPATRTALEAGDIDVSRALVLARIGDPAHQAKGLEIASRKHGGEFVFSVRDLASELGSEGFTISLKLAPFDVADGALLPERGSCEGCEFRSANHDPDAADLDVCTNRSCYEKKVKAHGARALKAAEEHGLPVLRGEAAKKITAGKDRYVGFVDLDTACDFDEFPEPEPKDDDAWTAWAEREQEWQPRTYRQLLALANATVQTTLLEGKGKRVIELAPFKELQALLKKKADIKLPAHIAQKPAPAPTAPRYDYKAEQAKQEERRLKAEEAAARERAWRIPVLAAIVKAKPAAKLTRNELIAVTEDFLTDWTVQEGLRRAGFKLPDMKKATDEQFIRALRIAVAAIDITSTDGTPDELLALAKACKVDVAKIKKQAAATAAAPDKRK